MSQYSDFLTMKLIEKRRFDKNGMTDNFRQSVLESSSINKNLNVRTKVDLIASVEVLATMFNVSKAQLVTEILESATEEAITKLEKDGYLDNYMQNYLKNMNENYGFKLIYDDDGKPQTLDLTEL